MLFAYERPLCGHNWTFPQGQFLTLTDIDCRRATQATWFRVRLACGRRRTKSLSVTESESRFETASGSYRSSERRWRKREAIAMSNDQKKIVSASAAEPLGAELERLLQPTRYFQHPRDVVRHATLTTAEKRAILSSWASDACAVESMPALRQILGSGHVVKFDEVIDALQELDGKADDIGGMEKPQRRRRGPDRGGNPEEGPAGSGYWY